MAALADPHRSDAPAGGFPLGALFWAYLGGAGVGLGAWVAGMGPLSAVLLGWIAAVALTVAVAGLAAMRRGESLAARDREIAAWQADLEEEARPAAPRRDVA